MYSNNIKSAVGKYCLDGLEHYNLLGNKLGESNWQVAMCPWATLNMGSM